MKALERTAALAILGAAITVMAAPIASAAETTCGVSKYHDEKSGKCVDARDRPSGKTWADELLAKKWGP
jgi:hypothetical protein